ncbi:N-acyl homoserine lactonase family protein [Nonomuraea sp. 3-1Str]|uniref:N-acyl homoserine lactonase family protein n=1 Tax=Nonomuraea sp. 3-1Str TaxID=2929801 RepID=UPI0028640479|nr:N-acyl homoserine lactonase family protein [Nonomuraea sp. 3-1Str]MDR8407835.1 N-acyl homoserine lactonase family protein [Nonomuraea sp. 3-1Str]
MRDEMANMMSPIKHVSVVSTGTVAIHPEHVAATRKPMYWWLFTSRRWTPPLPINVYVIEHEDGLVLFDAGQDRASVTDPGYFPGGITGVMYDRLARFDIGPADTLTARLAAGGYDIADVHTVVISHLHQDHIGGLRELTGAEIVVSGKEWQTLDGALPELRGLLRSHIDLPGLRWRRIEFGDVQDPGLAPFTTGHDLFGDGSLVLLPTPGHTPGSLSLLVRGPGHPPLLMVGDLTYDAHLLQEGHTPGVGERRQLADTTKAINSLREHNPGLVILPAHDPGAAARLAPVTTALAGRRQAVAHASR